MIPAPPAPNPNPPAQGHQGTRDDIAAALAREADLTSEELAASILREAAGSLAEGIKHLEEQLSSVQGQIELLAKRHAACTRVASSLEEHRAVH